MGCSPHCVGAASFLPSLNGIHVVWPSILIGSFATSGCFAWMEFAELAIWPEQCGQRPRDFFCVLTVIVASHSCVGFILHCHHTRTELPGFTSEACGHLLPSDPPSSDFGGTRRP